MADYEDQTECGPTASAEAEQPAFTAHNVQLDDGSWTIPGGGVECAVNPWFTRALATMRLALGGDVSGASVVDIGCLEGGYTIEFARAGFGRAVGLEVRHSNFTACRWLQQCIPSLRNLEFVHDDAWNLELYAPFDAAFCCGLLYHLDRPAEYLSLLGRVVRRVLVVNTHFAPVGTPDARFPLSEPAENEGLPGRWFFEHDSDDAAERETYRWSAWANHRSFWLRREALAHAIRAAGFDLVYEQFDCHVTEGETDLLQTLREGYPATQHRTVFVGVRTT